MPHWYNHEGDSERRTNLDNWRTATVILSKIRGWLKRSWAFCDRKDIGQVSIKLSSDRCQSWNETRCISKRMTICIDVCFRMMRRSGQTTTKVRKKRRCTYTRSHFRWTLFVAFSLFAAAVVPFASTCISLIFWYWNHAAPSWKYVASFAELFHCKFTPPSGRGRFLCLKAAHIAIEKCFARPQDTLSRKNTSHHIANARP